MSSGQSPVVVATSARSTAEDRLFPATYSAFRFVRENPFRVTLCSALLLIPCLWHRHIQSVDLASHLYNAWLAQLIRAGQTPGLHIVPQYTNVLFDWILSGLFLAFGPTSAERIAAYASVLVYFWGAFALCAAAAGRARWLVTPILSMAAYGYIFHMGFFNMYLSAGIGLFALAIVWRGRRWDFVLLAPLFALTWLAHLMGAAAFLALAAFVGLARVLRLRWHVALTIGSLFFYSALLRYVYGHFEVMPRDADVYWLWGPDQLVVFTREYAWIAVLIFVFALVSFALYFVRERIAGIRRASVWLHLWIVVGFVGYSMPGGIVHPRLQSAGFLPDRISLYTIVFLCCLLALIRNGKFQFAAFSAIAVAYFALLNVDTGHIDRLETKIGQAVSTLPQGTRVVATLFPVKGSRIYVQHAIDRACIGHCYSLGNYEPSSGQFRIRADVGNRFVAADHESSAQMQRGFYPVATTDLPLAEVHVCGIGLRDVCVHQLQAGEMSGQAAFEEFHLRAPGK